MIDKDINPINIPWIGGVGFNKDNLKGLQSKTYGLKRL